MSDFLFKFYPLIIFIFLASLKGIIEFTAYKKTNKGENESSKLISLLFIIAGIFTPITIILEILIFKHEIPASISLFFAFLYLILLISRFACIRTLGKYYSVNVRIAEKHELIKTGIYKYFRHPIYLIGILENIFYPIACSAYISSIILFTVITPVILIRRHNEEKLLIEKFKDEYLEYKKATLF